MRNFHVVHKKLPKRERKLVAESGMKPGSVWREARRREDIRAVIAEEWSRFRRTV
jgi:hypothetical protein